MSLKIPCQGFSQTPTAERVLRRYLFNRTWDSMCTPGSPHYEANLRDLIVKDNASNSETGGKAEENTKGEKEKVFARGKSRAKNKDTDSEQNPGSTTNNKKPKRGEVNPELLKALKVLEMPATNPKQTNGDEAAKAEDDDHDGGQREQRGGLISSAAEITVYSSVVVWQTGTKKNSERRQLP